jgi:hypothetical protein
MKTKQNLIIGGSVILICAAAVLVIMLTHRGSTPFNLGGSNNSITVTERSEKDPLDTVVPFYSDWLNAIFSTSSNPYDAGLATDTRLSESVRTYIAEAKANNPTGVDPVLCQTAIPPRVGSKVVFALPDKAQIMMLPRGVGRVPEAALVDLAPSNGEWQITKISCINGESAPEREFSFEKEGYILKGQAPLDPQYWYAVYEENGQQGYSAPLFFSDASVCVEVDGDERSCDTNWFMNPSPAKIKGEMTESGVEVKRIEFMS